MEEINKVIKNKRYIYLNIVNVLKKYKNDYIIENQYQIINDENLFEKIINKLEKYISRNNINVEIPNININLNKIKLYCTSIIKSLKKEDLRSIHFEIFKILLPSKKRKTIKENNNINKKIFSIYDFIENYSKKAIEILIKDDFEQKDLDKLNEIYLYYIFQIIDTENVKKLKLLIYEHLYQNTDIKEFIKKSSEIVNMKNVNDSKLRDYETKYDEYNIFIRNVPYHYETFFSKDLQKKIFDLFQFYDDIWDKNNEAYFNNEIINIKEKQLVIDDLNYNINKIHLFSTEFLIMNGLKKELEECDFEIFNEGNLSIDLFAKFLRRIIEELNNYLKDNNFKNDFLIKHHIKLNSNYISGIFDYNDKKEFKEMENKNDIRNQFIKIKIYQNKNQGKKGNTEEEEDKEKDKKEEDKEKDKKEEDKEKDKKEEEKKEKNNQNHIRNDNKKKKIQNNNSDTNSVKYSLFSYQTMSDIIINKAYDFEELINELLIKKFDKNEIISLPNIMFKLNLKIPKYNGKNNSIEFKSVHLDYSDKYKTQENDIHMYGFKEIDAAFKSNSYNFIDVDYSKYFNNNLEYFKGKFAKCFVENRQNKNFFIHPETIFFGEIKNSFPNSSNGREKFQSIKIDQIKKNEENNEVIDELFSYKEQLKKLINKFTHFFDVYKKENINIKNIQIVILYDNMNVMKIITDESKLKEETVKILNNFDMISKINENIIFQLIFFDSNNYNKNLSKENINLKLEVKNKDDENISLKLEVKNKDDENKNLKSENINLKNENINLKKDIEVKNNKVLQILSDSNLPPEKLFLIEKLLKDSD